MPQNSPRRSGARCFVSRMTELLEPRVLLAAVSWDGGGGDGQWTNPLNWSNDALPGPADDVTVAGANVALAIGAGAQTVNSFAFANSAMVTLRASLSAAAASRIDGVAHVESGGVLAGAGNVTVNGRLDQTSGSTLGGTGDTIIAAGGLLEAKPVSASQTILARHVTVEVGGQILFSPSIDGTFWDLSGAEIENHGQLLVRGVPPQSGFYNWAITALAGGHPPSLVTNYGVITIDPIFAGIWYAPLVNHGTFDVVHAGVTFNQYPITNHGVMRAPSGTSIEFGSSDTQHLTGASVEGAGLFNFHSSGADVFAAGTFNPSGQVWMQSGTVELNEPFTGFTLRDNTIGIATLVFSTPQTLNGVDLRRGSILGSGDVTLTGTTTWGGDGVLGGTGKVIIPAGATLRLTQGFGTNSVKRIQRRLEVFGTFRREGGGVVMTDGTIHIMGGGLFHDSVPSGALTPDIRSNGGMNAVIVDGTFSKTGTATWEFGAANGGVRFEGAGETAFTGGTLRIAGGGTRSGPTYLDPAATLAHASLGGYTYAPGAGIAAHGALRFDAGANTVGGAISGAGSVAVSGGATARFDAARRSPARLPRRTTTRASRSPATRASPI